MSFNVLVTITGSTSLGPFQIAECTGYSEGGCTGCTDITNPSGIDITVNELTNGHYVNVTNDNTTSIQLTSSGTCDNVICLLIDGKPTLPPTNTPTATPTGTPTATSTPTPTPTSTPIPNTPTPTPTATSTPTPTPTSTPTTNCDSWVGDTSCSFTTSGGGGSSCMGSGTLTVSGYYSLQGYVSINTGPTPLSLNEFTLLINGAEYSTSTNTPYSAGYTSAIILPPGTYPYSFLSEGSGGSNTGGGGGLFGQCIPTPTSTPEPIYITSIIISSTDSPPNGANCNEPNTGLIENYVWVIYNTDWFTIEGGYNVVKSNFSLSDVEIIDSGTVGYTIHPNSIVNDSSTILRSSSDGSYMVADESTQGSGKLLFIKDGVYGTTTKCQTPTPTPTNTPTNTPIGCYEYTLGTSASSGQYYSFIGCDGIPGDGYIGGVGGYDATTVCAQAGQISTGGEIQVSTVGPCVVEPTPTPTNTPEPTPTTEPGADGICFGYTYTQYEVTNNLLPEVRYRDMSDTITTSAITGLITVDNNDGTFTGYICVKQGSSYATPVCVDGQLEVSCPNGWSEGSSCSSVTTCAN